MKSIITTYPDFQSLPQGIKRMLLASESHFFAEVSATASGSHRPLQARTRMIDRNSPAPSKRIPN
jgi:hypothetical protein